ncbi:L,D-peptidoglycan transpeptidase YkuD, ErfK/YbiS/YcfS/YnhG family [Cohnella sp. OV330]|uniref:L,D-transpeptidase family protein n=1 Tax=Cohnella sp. OV330 TaxID=1855288 RepID=UPI0008F365C0|nr:L,D-transpeptidase family protein [Cohnella sp. OV330]SFB60107.1 L,D-peptidoglycan transpeptidase YkuD, ErfK/YbiS/YcfS/YnhG family [Cohnella sp. OV330]
MNRRRPNSRHTYSLVHTMIAAWIVLALLPALSLVPAHASAASFMASWPYKANLLGAEQVVVVEAKSLRAQTGVLSLREKQPDGRWTVVLSGIPVALGKNGIAKTKEGDGRTPSGVYPLGEAFGTASKPKGLKLAYKQTTKQDYWVDDPTSADYNRWVAYAGNPDRKWHSYERLYQPLYKYGIVVRYNDDPIVPGRGSAIFLHLWRDAGKPTAGCIAMSEPNLLKLMAALDPARSPAIAIGLAG